jgi:hypothetical protein
MRNPAPGTTYGGIENECAQASSYVNHVRIFGLQATGLKVGASAANSGPYTNLAIVDPESYPCGSGGSSSCVDIEAATQGLHGITCVGDASTLSQGDPGRNHPSPGR